MSSSEPWMNSLSCSNPSSSPSILSWVEFIFLSPCPQRLLLSSIDALFLLLLLGFHLHRLLYKLNSGNQHGLSLRVSHHHHRSKLCLIATVSFAVLHLSIAIVALTSRSNALPLPWRIVNVTFGIIQAVTFALIVIFNVGCIQVFWVASFLINALFVAAGLTRWVSGNDDVNISTVSLMSLVLITVLIVDSIWSSTQEVVGCSPLAEPLLEKPNVSGFATASLVSKSFWLWMNPLLSKGYKTPLTASDVPTLSPEHKAERMSELFESKWPKPHEKCKNPVRTTLLRCFWKELVFTAFLAVVRLCATYVGPVLINKFIDFTMGVRSSPNEGYYLVLTLLTAKFFEVLCSHQFNFNSQKLGMVIRSTLITSLYKKGLKLSCSSRQAYGVGQIVNYMSIDAQQLSDMMLQLHAVWLMPLQLIVALFLLQRYLGSAVIMSFFGLIFVLLFVTICTRRNRLYQFKLMQNRDSRMKAVNETLNCMRVIKFQAWEEKFNDRIKSFRTSEFGWLAKFLYSYSANIVIMSSTPMVISAITFGTAILMGKTLDATTVFTTTTIFKILQEPIRSFPQSMIQISQAMISMKRLDDFMMSKELKEDSVEKLEGYNGSTTAVEIEDGHFSWDDEGGDLTLKDINFKVKKGQLVAIVGTVGSGKSSLLASILGEMHKVRGQVRVHGTTAYVAQTSWIQNGTIEENILFGLPMNREKYTQAVNVCCLEKDLEIMEFGDQTEIGERGVNLSGGQKQRIQLARAVYQDCDTYLLDDVFSAVDAHTGSNIFKGCLRGALQDKTVILVTHQVDFLHNFDLILVMRDGKLVKSEQYHNLLEAAVDFKALVAAHETSMELVEAGSNNIELPRELKSPEAKSENNPWLRPEALNGESKLIKEEERETGKVSLRLYKDYCTNAFGWSGVAVVLLISMSWQLTVMASDYWLAYESSEERASYFDPSLFILMYAMIAAVSVVLILVRAYFTTIFALETGQIFFYRILHSLLHAPMSFFDTTPSGRILSRASSDQLNVDLFLPFMLHLTIAVYMTLFSIIIITSQYTWPTVFLLIPLGWLNLWYRRYYLATSRELTRLDSVNKAPVIHHFSESIMGFMTIRCFRKKERFIQENVNLVNLSLRMDFHFNASNEWLGFRLELLGSLLLCASALFMILLPPGIVKPENVGMSLSYGLSLSATLFSAIYMSCYVENRMVSVERIKQFTEIPSEAAWTINDYCPPHNWPSQGKIELRDLQVRYRPNTPLVLKGITLSIKGGDKVGVVGRTGSGKSTLIQVFFRLVEPSGGEIIVDDIDISTLGLHDLRSRFGIIPQDPILFEGTVRSNIDPIGQYSDDEIWKSLERCQLKDVVASKPKKLDAQVVENGDNWSVGQKQLLCLGRVMLKKSRLLFMDEATASIDTQTDALIQKVIKQEFANCTIISIAHRMPTVMDCDKVLVIDAGIAKEFNSPSWLLDKPSLFGALVQEYANRSSGL